MKEYSKSMLRRHKQSERLRERRTAFRKGAARAATPAADEDALNPMNLIRREVAIMKKLDHPNIVTLIEVLDDPHADSLYLILEWCGKGAIVPLIDGDSADNNDSGKSSSSSFSSSSSSSASSPSRACTIDQCRLYFRDMILGIEYLHSQGVIHRDIKADNILLDEDDVVKIADFGVSEILDPENDIITKTVGSPAYMAPELAALSSHAGLKLHAEHKGINVSTLSGKSTDIWSMGVTLYLLVYGKLPFRGDTLADLFASIVNDEIELPSPQSTPGTADTDSDNCSDDDEDDDENLRDLLAKILTKIPSKRITMAELRLHPWVTYNGQDMLLQYEENTAVNITPVTEEDLYFAIEFVQASGIMESTEAMARLRRLHGWRGYANTNTMSANGTSANGTAAADILPVPGPRPPMIARSPSPADAGSVSMYKLTRALEEVVKSARDVRSISNSRSHSSTRTSSDHDTGRGSVRNQNQGRKGYHHGVTKSQSQVGTGNEKGMLDLVESPTTTTNSFMSTSSPGMPNLFGVEFQEPVSVTPPVLEAPPDTVNSVLVGRKPSYTRPRGEGMPRSRSMDPEARVVGLLQ